MAIAKDIAIHDLSGVANCVDYITDEEKTVLSNCGININDEEPKGMEEIDKLLDYVQNDKKTTIINDGDNELLVSGYLCSPDTAAFEFQMARDKYNRYTQNEASRVRGNKKDSLGNEVQKQSIEAHHVIQSFPEIPDLDPRLVHQLGIEFAKRAFPNHKVLIATHMNTNHYHNHLIVCAYNEDSIGKYHMNMESRKHYRKINDEISLEYGLPILIDSGQEHKALSWYEWNVKNNGESWKDIIRRDIEQTAKLCHSWNEFVSKMEQAGYTIRDKKHVTYTLPGSDTKKVRDDTLGPEYTRASLKASWGEIEESISSQKNSVNKNLGTVIVPNSSNPTQTTTVVDENGLLDVKSDIFDNKSTDDERKKNVISNTEKIVISDNDFKKSYNGNKVVFSLRVSRYTESGRRRSDLEILFLKAIKLLKFFKDYFFDNTESTKHPDNPIYSHYDTKLKAMEHSLVMCNDLGLTSKKQLKDLMNKTGSELSHAKKEVNNLKQNTDFNQNTLNAIDEMSRLKAMLTDVIANNGNHKDIDLSNMFVKEFTEEEIRHNRAVKMPMSNRQRQALFVKTQDTDWRFKYKYEDITYQQAKNIIDFLDGKITEKPEELITTEEFQELNISRKYESIRKKNDKNLQEKYENRPISSAMVNKITNLLAENNVSLAKPVDELNMYQGMKIIGYYSNNEYNGPLISQDKIDKLNQLLMKKGATLNRPTQYVLESEYQAIINNLENGTYFVPDILKPSSKARLSNVEQLRELLVLKGETCSIPLEELSQTDANKLQTYLLNKDVVPNILRHQDMITNDEPNLDNDFLTAIKDFSLSDQQTFSKYRAILTELKSYGIDVTDIDRIKTDMKYNIMAAESLKATITELEHKYKQLSRLNYNINLASNTPFTHGPLFNKTTDIKIEERTVEQASQDLKHEDEMIQKEISQKVNEEIQEKNAKENPTQGSTKKKFFNGIDDSFFDRV